MQKPVETILFDLDGVLADSESWWDQIDTALLAEHGVDYRGEHKRQVLGKSFALSLGFYKDQYQLRSTIEELMLRRRFIAADFYARHIMPFPAAREVLKFLRGADYKIGLATSSVRPIVMPFLERHELASFFHCIVTGEDVQNGKPNPDIYLRAAALASTEPEACLVVEDALAGVAAGKSAGAMVVAIPDPRFVNPEEYVGKADYIIEHIGDLPDLVKAFTGIRN